MTYGEDLNYVQREKRSKFKRKDKRARLKSIF